MDVCAEEVAEGDDVAFASLTEQPAIGFVHEVVRVGEVAEGQLEGQIRVPLPQPVHGGDDGNAFVPYPLGVRKAAEEVGVVRVERLAAEDLIRRQVHQIPVVDVRAMTEVEVGRGRAYRPRPGPLISLHKHQQTAEAHLVKVALKKPTQILVARLGIIPTRHAAHPWHGHPEEAIALAILSRAGLEEARQVGRLSDGSEGLQFALYLVRDHGSSFQISSSTARFGTWCTPAASRQ